MGYSFRKKPDCTDDGNTFLVQPKDVTVDGFLNVHGLCRTDLPSGKRLNAGDVLLINRGRFTACIFDGAVKEPCIALSAFMIFSPKDPSQLHPEYLVLFFNSSYCQTLFKRLHETTTIPFISMSNLESVEIPLPSIEHQAALVALDQMNKDYARLSSRKLALQKQLLDHELTLLTQEHSHV